MSKKQPLPQSPSGLPGMIFGKIMEWANSDSYRKAMNALQPVNEERYLEIGFGTGLFAELLLSNSPGAILAGVDPTPTMVETAVQRLKKRGFGGQIDFRAGTDETLNWNDDYFDGVVAIHSFQFWAKPEETLKAINRVLKSDGRLVIVFRAHASNPPAWLPNPLSRTGQEIEMTIKLLEHDGYRCVEYPAAGSSRILRGNRII